VCGPQVEREAASIGPTHLPCEGGGCTRAHPPPPHSRVSCVRVTTRDTSGAKHAWRLTVSRTTSHGTVAGVGVAPTPHIPCNQWRSTRATPAGVSCRRCKRWVRLQQGLIRRMIDVVVGAAGAPVARHPAFLALGPQRLAPRGPAASCGARRAPPAAGRLRQWRSQLQQWRCRLLGPGSSDTWQVLALALPPGQPSPTP
jgi:hypothetical protein